MAECSQRVAHRPLRPLLCTRTASSTPTPRSSGPREWTSGSTPSSSGTDAQSGTIGLVNNGLLSLDPNSGKAFVDKNREYLHGRWSVSLGGYAIGEEHGLLQVKGGDATLDGVINVGLIDTRAEIFLPSISDEFIVLSVIGGVIGGLLNDPVSVVGVQTYEWTVVYTPTP